MLIIVNIQMINPAVFFKRLFIFKSCLYLKIMLYDYLHNHGSDFESYETIYTNLLSFDLRHKLSIFSYSSYI